MLVRPVLGDSALELAKRGGQKASLDDEPLGAAVRRSARLEEGEGAALEVGHAVPAQPQLVVEPQYFGNESGPDLERWLDSRLACRPAGRAEQRLAFGPGQHRAGVKAFGEALGQLPRCDEIRQDDRTRCGDCSRFDAVAEVRCRSAGGQEDQSVAGIERRALARQRHDGFSKCPQVRRTGPGGDTRCGTINQCSMPNAQCSTPPNWLSVEL